MIRYLSVAALLAVGATVAIAQNADAIKQRREVMKAIAGGGSEPFKMSKGELPFDLAKVKAMLKVYQEQGPKLKTLFPDNSKTGDTEAPAKIWQSKTEFDAAVDEFVAVAKAGEAAIVDEATFKAEYTTKVQRSCGGCHKREDGFAPPLSQSFKRLQQ